MSSTEDPAITTPHEWSLQKRLTWQLTLAIGVLLGGLFLVLDVLVDRAMYAQLDQFLAARAEAFAKQVPEHDPQELPGLLPTHDLAGHAEFFALYDADRKLRLTSANSGEGALSLPKSEGLPNFHDVLLPDSHRGRAVVLRLQRGRFLGGWLVLATERETWDRTEATVHGVLLSGTALAIVLAVLLCLWLLRQAFSSIRAEGERLVGLRIDEDATLATRHLPSELRPYAMAVRDALRRLMMAAERERRFSRDIAHELRTPLAEVRASAEHALDANDAHDLRTGLKAILAANSRMERGIQALLALARYESGQIAPALDPLDLASLLRQQVHGLAQAEGFDAKQHFDMDLPSAVWVHSDVGMLERILTNLLHNAYEYGSHETPARVWIETHEGAHTLCFRNAAPEIDAEDISRFGERYWRGRGADGDAGHAGLGLALASAMAEALGLNLAFALEEGAVVARLGTLAAL